MFNMDLLITLFNIQQEKNENEANSIPIQDMSKNNEINKDVGIGNIISSNKAAALNENNVNDLNNDHNNNNKGKIYVNKK